MEQDAILWTDKKRTLFGLPLSFTRYYLTEHQLITRTGFLSIREDEIELYRIVDKRIEQPFSQRIFGCGTLIINSRDVDTPEKHLISIRHPKQVSRLIGACVREEQERLHIIGRDMVGAVAFPDWDTPTNASNDRER
jgi:hypothetical protein